MDYLYFDSDDNELQSFLFFIIVVAGKSAKVARNKVDNIFSESDKLPFDYLSELIENDTLEEKLRYHKTGNYRKLIKASHDIVDNFVNGNLSLRTCTVEDLEKIHGISFKNSRYFIVYSRKGASNYAILDRHILKFLKGKGYKNIPKNSPQNMKEYKRIERLFLEEANKLNKSNHELDSELWMAFSKSSMHGVNNVKR